MNERDKYYAQLAEDLCMYTAAIELEFAYPKVDLQQRVDSKGNLLPPTDWLCLAA